MERRQFLTTAILGSIGLAGCSDRRNSTSPVPTDELIVSGPGEYPHEIRIENSSDRRRTLTVTVERNGTRVYRDTHAAEPGFDGVVAGISAETLPRGSRRLTLTASDADGQESAVEVSVSDCLGDVVFYVTDDGSLESTYSIC